VARFAAFDGREKELPLFQNIYGQDLPPDRERAKEILPAIEAAGPHREQVLREVHGG